MKRRFELNQSDFKINIFIYYCAAFPFIVINRTLVGQLGNWYRQQRMIMKLWRHMRYQ